MSLDNNFQVGGNHYKGTALEHWDWVESQCLTYLEGCTTKYISRWKKKHKYNNLQRIVCGWLGIKLASGFEDLEKAKHYIAKIIQRDEIAAELLYNQTGDNPTWSDNCTRNRCMARSARFTEEFIKAQDAPRCLAHAIRLVVHARNTGDLATAIGFIDDEIDLHR
jgi:hypothetical protein